MLNVPSSNATNEFNFRVIKCAPHFGGKMFTNSIFNEKFASCASHFSAGMFNFLVIKNVQFSWRDDWPMLDLKPELELWFRRWQLTNNVQLQITLKFVQLNRMFLPGIQSWSSGWSCSGGWTSLRRGSGCRSCSWQLFVVWIWDFT